MNTCKIRQVWLTPGEAADVLRQHNIPLLPADLFRHALHGDLMLSVYFPSPVHPAGLPAAQKKTPSRRHNAINPAAES